MILTKLKKINAKHAVVIPQKILDQLKIDQETELCITTDGISIFIKPGKQSAKISDNPKIQKLYDTLTKEHEALLKKLADS